MDYKKKIFSTTVIYFFGQMGARLFSFLLLPLYTNYISAEAYGLFDIAQTYLSVLVPVTFFEIWSGTLRFGISAKDKQERSIVFSTSAGLFAFSLLVFTVGMVLVDCFFKIPYFQYIWIYTFTWAMDLFIKACCRALANNKVYAISGVITTITVSVVSMVSIFIFKKGIETLFIANAMAYFIDSLYITFSTKLWDYLKIIQVRRQWLKTLIKFCLPLSLNSVFYWLLSSVNRIIIVDQLGLKANGLYAVANKFGSIITIFVSISMLSWQEILFSTKSNEEIQSLYDESFPYILKLLLCSQLCLIPLMSLSFKYMIGNAYSETYLLTVIMAFSVLFTSINSFVNVLYSAINRTKFLIIDKLFGCIINLIFLFWLIPLFGLLSSPIAITVSQITCIMVNILCLRKYIFVRLDFKVLIGGLLLLTVATVIYLTNNWLYNVLALLVFLLISLLVLKRFVKGFLMLLLERIKNA